MNSSTKTKIIIRDLGKCDYLPVWDEMKSFTQKRDKTTPDEIWVLEHFPVFTQGQAGKAEHIVNPGNIPVVQTDRGGQVTYHGPGQIVAYLLFDLHRIKIGIKKFVSTVEESVIQLLSDFDICANTKPNAPGVYVGESKICSLGLKVSKGCTYHGLALNAKMDLEPFLRINPCGFKNITMTQISALNSLCQFDETKKRLCDYLIKNFECVTEIKE